MAEPSTKRKSIAKKSPRDPYFDRSKKEERYKRYVLRKTVPHKFLELDWFVEKGFTFPRLLIAQNLNNFCTLNGNVYPELVYEFYANLVNRKKVWVTNVSGETITLNTAVLEAVGNLQHTGLTYEQILDPNWSVFKALDTYEGCLRPGKRYDGKTMKTGSITVNDRMLHYVLVNLIAPRLSNRAQMVDEDSRYMCAIKNGIMVNWADVVLNIMLRRFKDPTGVLPYPALVSKIIEHAGVEVEEETKLFVKDGADRIGSTVLNKMKISRKDGVWVWDEDENDVEMAEDENSQNFSMEELMNRMQGMLDTSLGPIREDIRGLKEDIRILTEKAERGFDQMGTRLGELEAFDPNLTHDQPPAS